MPVAIIIAANQDGTYYLVVVAVKAEALPTVMNQIAPAVGEWTMVLAFLNDMAHLKALNDRFKAARVLGGPATDRIRRIHSELSVPGIEVSIAEDAVAAMWHKWAFITAAELGVDIPLTALALLHLHAHDHATA